ncbi:MAG: hypothetical protein LBO67_03705 [Spirochaetaceae bacterium]|nr:hypothetical protein [Spirochaetaceae bacterium]
MSFDSGAPFGIYQGMQNCAGLFEEMRKRQQERSYKLFSSTALCITGALMLPALVFNPDTFARGYQFLLFWLFLILSGKKNNALMTVLVMLTIIFFNLLAPFGRVLYAIGSFKITDGALKEGIKRAVTLEGLILLSRVSIRDDLRLPGTFGELISESLRLFARLSAQKMPFDRHHIVASLDALLSALNAEPSAPQSARIARTSRAGALILIAAVLLTWLPYILSFLNGQA